MACHAEARAVNPFESLLRAITIEAGLHFDVQHPIDVTGMTVHPDLADLEGRVILEAHSWGFRTGRKAHVRDCWRYNELVAEGWSVLRLTWWHVIKTYPDYVVETISRVCGRSLRRAEGQDSLRGVRDPILCTSGWRRTPILKPRMGWPGDRVTARAP